jgi:hypothetical protein
MSKVLLYALAAGGAGLAYAYANKLGPFAAPETGIDPGKALTGTEGLSLEDVRALGIGPGGAPSTGEGGELYRRGVADYMTRTWRRGGASVPYSLAIAKIQGQLGVANVGGSQSAATSSAFYLGNLGGKLKTGTGTAILPGIARGFMVNQYQAAVYLPDAGRLFGLVQLRRKLKDGTQRDVDGFVAAGSWQNIDNNGTLFGLGELYAWDPIASEWVAGSELLFRGSLSKLIKQSDGRYLTAVGSPTRYGPDSPNGDPWQSYVYGYSDQRGRRIRGSDLENKARGARKVVTL